MTITRREFHKFAIGSTAAVSMLSGCGSVGQLSDEKLAKDNDRRIDMDKKPNILLIMPDQWRGDCLSSASHPVVITPNVDELGGKGVRFSRAYTTCASCIPARRSLLTGKYPSSNGMVGFLDGYPIPEPTLPEMLKKGGYSTAIVGRYMHQYPYEESYGYDKRILGSTYIQDDDYAKDLEEAVPGAGGIRGVGISFNGWHAKPWPYSEHIHPTNWVVRKGRELINNHNYDKPLFLTSSFYAPHPPLIPPAFYMERCLDMDLPPAKIGKWETKPDSCFGAGVDSPRTVLEGEALRNAQAGYFGLINHLDDQLYWLITDFQIKSRQSGRPWVIVFTSDHGEMLGDHYYFRKCEPYEGSARIPLLIQVSEDYKAKAGLVNDNPVCLEDIMPTLLDLAGIGSPEGIDGKSLVPIILGENTAVREVLHGEHSTCYSKQQAYHMLTDGRFKYIWRPFDGSQQLFDLVKDPDELNDLAADKKMQSNVAAWRKKMIEQLKDRPEGFAADGELVAGREYKETLPFLKKG